ncbi:MAG: DUF2127 domain-containing protein [Candidatus Diapherotrites archaeon]
MAKSKKVAKSKEAKEFPAGVQIISILVYIVSILSALMGLLFLIYGIAFSDLLIETLGELGPGILIVFGGFLLCIGVLGIFVGRGLWKRQNWARITAITLLCITIILSIYSLLVGGSIVGNLIAIVISGVIAGYLIFSKEAGKAFK